MLIEQLKGTPPHKQLLDVCVSLVSECFQRGNYKDGMWFLQGLASVSSLQIVENNNGKEEDDRGEGTAEHTTKLLDEKSVDALFQQILSKIKDHEDNNDDTR